MMILIKITNNNQTKCKRNFKHNLMTKYWIMN